MNTIGKYFLLFFIMFIALLVFTIVFGVIENNKWMRDIEGYGQLAITSANADVMLEYLNKVDESFIEHGWTEGHTTFIVQNPKTNLSNIYRQLTDFRERLTVIAEMDQSSFEYQKGLEEVTESLILWGDSFNLKWKFYNGMTVRILTCILIMTGFISFVVAAVSDMI